MSAVLQRDHKDQFFDSQMLPPQERGVTFEALFFPPAAAGDQSYS